MQKDLFEYAVIRVVPRVEREEFINVGVILYCSKLKFLSAIIHLDEAKALCLDAKLDLEFVSLNLRAIQHICEGGENSGPIGQFDLAARFRWLTATRSTVVQTSKVHPGFCSDPQIKLKSLYEQLVL